MDIARLNELAKSLNGISYYEWQKLRMIVDGAFVAKVDMFKSELQLEEDADYEDVIRSRF